MAKEDSEFQKLLSEAPAVANEDTVTVVGLLSRTADTTKFVLTLPNGRTETLNVAAVKSVKKLAGAIGQSLVELELDAKDTPESFKKDSQLDGQLPNNLFLDFRYSMTYADRLAFGTPFYHDIKQPWFDYPTPYPVPGPVPLPDPLKAVGDLPGRRPAEGVNICGGIGNATALAPFVSAAPHQVDPDTIAALALLTGSRTYFSAYSWTTDHHYIPKVTADRF